MLAVTLLLFSLFSCNLERMREQKELIYSVVDDVDADESLVENVDNLLVPIRFARPIQPISAWFVADFHHFQIAWIAIVHVNAVRIRFRCIHQFVEHPLGREWFFRHFRMILEFSCLQVDFCLCTGIDTHTNTLTHVVQCKTISTNLWLCCPVVKNVWNVSLFDCSSCSTIIFK